MIANGTGYDNIAIGRSAMQTGSNGNSNVAVGSRSLLKNTGQSNIALGRESLTNNTSGSRNIAIGPAALRSNIIGQDNIAIGYLAQRGIAGSIRNISVGNISLFNLDDGDNNIGIGDSTLVHLEFGSNNVAFGKNAGANTLGSGNIFLGHKSGYNETGSDRIYIDNNDTSTPIIYGELDNDLLRINGTFQVHHDSNEVMSTSYDTTDNYGEVTIKDIMTLTPRTDPPTTPSKGMIYYNDTDNLIYFYNGIGWVSL